MKNRYLLIFIVSVFLIVFSFVLLSRTTTEPEEPPPAEPAKPVEPFIIQSTPLLDTVLMEVQILANLPVDEQGGPTLFVMQNLLEKEAEDIEVYGFIQAFSPEDKSSLESKIQLMHNYLLDNEFSSESVTPENDSTVKLFSKYTRENVVCFINHTFDDSLEEQTLQIGCFEEEETLIGGQRDTHGCLGPAGYSYNEPVGACIREWELNENQRKAAKIAVESSKKQQLTVVEVLEEVCEGCFLVKLQTPDFENYSYSLEKWEVL